jgi:hypothetical protein
MMRSAASALLIVLLAGGCATLTESRQETVMVQTVLDNREMIGAGCVLSNDAGKWFVTTPGPLIIRKSAAPLRVDCRKEGMAWADEKIEAKVNGSLWGNVVLTAGIGYLVDRNTGAGFDYPATLTIEMHREAAAPATHASPSHVY